MAENKSADHLDDFEKIELDDSKLTSPSKKHLIDLIDAVVVIALVFSIYFIAPYLLSLEAHAIMQIRRVYLIIGVFAMYRLVSFIIFSKTLSMFIFGTRYTKPSGDKLSMVDRLLAACMIYRNGIAMYSK